MINRRREMKERTNDAIILLSLLDCHFESHVSNDNYSMENFVTNKLIILFCD